MLHDVPLHDIVRIIERKMGHPILLLANITLGLFANYFSLKSLKPGFH